ncbi:protein kinase domain-containing protein [Nocardia rhizosphaerae]|uniref:non-specific serine/threonine protein kinase n=1 Tax=Nocardia rhizosphaerae TaxID=1691571 RepID=A0ABV8L6U6_9NOCA
MLEIGEVFAGFTVERMLGQGGMGTVYLARHPRLDRLTALKLLNRDLFADARIRARFEREADLAAGLDHPAIVTVFDRGAEGEQLWISMQYVDGIDAATVDPMTLPPERAVQIVDGVADALDYAHGRGVLHRDVKPANILLARSGGGQGERVFLTDFGIARLRADSTHLTQQGMFTATLAYASPEQMTGAELDHRSDQYSLACALYWLFTGIAPFDSPDPNEIIRGTLHLPPPPLSLRRAGLPPAMDAVLAAAMAKHPAARYDSCAAFAKAARKALTPNTPPLLPRAAGYYPPAPQPAPTPYPPHQVPGYPASPRQQVPAPQWRPPAPPQPPAGSPASPPGWQAPPPQPGQQISAQPAVAPQPAQQVPVPQSPIPSPPGVTAHSPSGRLGDQSHVDSASGVQPTGAPTHAPESGRSPDRPAPPARDELRMAEDAAWRSAAAGQPGADGADAAATDVVPMPESARLELANANAPTDVAAIADAGTTHDPASAGPGSAGGNPPTDFASSGADQGGAGSTGSSTGAVTAPGPAEAGRRSVGTAGHVPMAGVVPGGPLDVSAAEVERDSVASSADGETTSGAAGPGAPRSGVETAADSMDASADKPFALGHAVLSPSWHGSATGSGSPENGPASVVDASAGSPAPGADAPAGGSASSTGPSDGSLVPDTGSRGATGPEPGTSTPGVEPDPGPPATHLGAMRTDLPPPPPAARPPGESADRPPEGSAAPGAGQAPDAGRPHGGYAQDNARSAAPAPSVGHQGAAVQGPPQGHGWPGRRRPVARRISGVHRLGWLILAALVMALVALLVALIVVVAPDDDETKPAVAAPSGAATTSSTVAADGSFAAGRRVFPTLVPQGVTAEGAGYRGAHCFAVRSVSELEWKEPALQWNPITVGWQCERTGNGQGAVSYLVLEYATPAQVRSVVDAMPSDIRYPGDKEGIPFDLRRWVVPDPSSSRIHTAHQVISFPGDPERANYLLAVSRRGSSGEGGAPRPSAQEDVIAWWADVRL